MESHSLLYGFHWFYGFTCWTILVVKLLAGRMATDIWNEGILGDLKSFANSRIWLVHALNISIPAYYIYIILYIYIYTIIYHTRYIYIYIYMCVYILYKEISYIIFLQWCSLFVASQINADKGHSLSSKPSSFATKYKNKALLWHIQSFFRFPVTNLTNQTNLTNLSGCWQGSLQ